MRSMSHRRRNFAVWGVAVLSVQWSSLFFSTATADAALIRKPEAAAPSAETLMAIAKTFEQQGKFDHAVRIYRTILEDRPDHAGARERMTALFGPKQDEPKRDVPIRDETNTPQRPTQAATRPREESRSSARVVSGRSNSDSRARVRPATEIASKPVRTKVVSTPPTRVQVGSGERLRAEPEPVSIAPVMKPRKVVELVSGQRVETPEESFVSSDDVDIVVVESKAKESKAAGSKAAGSEAAGSEAAGSEADVSKPVESKTEEFELDVSKSVKPKVEEPKPAEPKVMESKPVASKPVEFDAKKSEAKRKVSRKRDAQSPFSAKKVEVQTRCEPAVEVEGFVELLDHQDPMVREGAVYCLGKFRREAWTAIPALIKSLDDENQFVRVHAILALWRIDALVSPTIDPLAKALESEDHHLSGLAKYVIREVGEEIPRGAVLDPIARDVDGSSFVAAARAFGKVKQDNALSRLIFIQALVAGDQRTRTSAAYALALVQPSDEGAIRSLIRALDDRDTSVRIAATYALGQIGPRASQAIPRIVEVLESDLSDSDLRECAHHTLRALDPDFATRLDGSGERVIDTVDSFDRPMVRGDG